MEVHLMRKLIIATTALAFLSSAFLAPIAWSPAFAQDTMSKGDASKDKMAKTTKKSKKSSKMKSDDATK
jgi:pentapeptide MXKDX repeat protein